MGVDLVLIAVWCAIEPVPISGLLLTLASKDGRRSGVGFAVGWILSFGGVIALTLALTGGVPLATHSRPSVAVDVTKIILGAGMLVFSLLFWRHATRRDRTIKATPRWHAWVDAITPVRAAFLAFLLQPWPLIAAGALTITQLDLQSASDVFSLLAFFFISSSVVLLCVGFTLLDESRAEPVLDRLRCWFDDHTAAIIATASAAVGLLLLGRGAAGVLT